MEIKQLITPVDVVARGVTAPGTHRATHMRLRHLDIRIEQEGSGSCDIGYELGNIVNGKFKTLEVETPNEMATFHLDDNVFSLLAKTPISPSEKGKNVYNMIKDRVYNYLTSQNVITEE